MQSKLDSNTFLLSSTTHDCNNRLTGKRLSCVRGDRLLFEQLDLEVGAGDCLHVTGANGSGKSSLLRILCGLMHPDDGDRYWNDELLEPHHFSSRCAYLGHKDGLKSELTATENLRFYDAIYRSGNAPRSTDELAQLIAFLGLFNVSDLLVSQLSFGQRRRLAFGRLLLHAKSIWILDEPFTGIDIEGSERLQKICHQHLRQQGILIVTHHSSLAQVAFADRVRTISLT